jgi:hypothetical protein
MEVVARRRDERAVSADGQEHDLDAGRERVDELRDLPSWGSRRLYSWRLRGAGSRSAAHGDWQPNAAFHIDYQDCHYQGVELMLCGGVGGYSTPRGSIAFGGLELVDLRRGLPDHQIPVNLFIDEGGGPNSGLALTHNAFFAYPLGNGSLRFYFMTESDNQADLLVYDATPWVNRP